MKRLISVAVSAAILVLLYTRIDVGKLGGALAGVDPWWFTGVLLLFIPAVILLAARYRALVPPGNAFGLWYSARLVLASAVLNAVLPSKLGDFSRAWALRKQDIAPVSVGLVAVMYDRALDLLFMLFMGAVALLMIPGKSALLWGAVLVCTGAFLVGTLFLVKPAFATFLLAQGGRLLPSGARDRLRSLSGAWERIHDYLAADRSQVGRVLAISFGSWSVNVLQTWFFVLALDVQMPFIDHVGLSTVAILIGLVPITFAGVGTRDAALILLYAPYMDAATGAAFGVLFTIRYIALVVAGLSFFGILVGVKPETTTAEQ